MNVVIDTNVLVSALWSKGGTCAKILYRVLNYELIVAYDQRIMHEYKVVLGRSKFGFTMEEVRAIIDFIKNEGMCIVAKPVDIKFEDEADKKFYEVAKTLNCKLITGNKKHFPDENDILSPGEFGI